MDFFDNLENDKPIEKNICCSGKYSYDDDGELICMECGEIIDDNKKNNIIDDKGSIIPCSSKKGGTFYNKNIVVYKTYNGKVNKRSLMNATIDPDDHKKKNLRTMYNFIKKKIEKSLIPLCIIDDSLIIYKKFYYSERFNKPKKYVPLIYFMYYDGIRKKIYLPISYYSNILGIDNINYPDVRKKLDNFIANNEEYESLINHKNWPDWSDIVRYHLKGKHEDKIIRVRKKYLSKPNNMHNDDIAYSVLIKKFGFSPDYFKLKKNYINKKIKILFP